MTRILRTLCWSFSTLCVALLADSAAGQTLEWAQPVDGDYFDSANWIPSVVPTDANDLLFNRAANGGSPYTVTIPGTPSINRPDALVVDPTGTQGDRLHVHLEMNGTQIRLNQFTDHLFVGQSDPDPAELSVSNGSLESPVSYLGYGAGTDGTLTLGKAAEPLVGFDSGRGNNLSEIHVGVEGTGKWDMVNALVKTEIVEFGVQSDGVGRAYLRNDTVWSHDETKTPAEARFLVGVAGGGEITIEDNARLETAEVTLGLESGSSGLVNIKDQGRWDADTFTVGASGHSRMDIDDGGQLTGSNGIIAANDGSFGSVDILGANSSWTVGNMMTLGDGGSGRMRVFNGATVNAGGTVIGGQDTGTGQLAVSGHDALFDAGNGFDVGYDGSGEIEVRQGGELQANHTDLGSRTGSVGSILVDGAGSLFDSHSTLAVGNRGEGHLDIRKGGQVTAARVYVARGAESQGAITLEDFGSVLDARELHVGGVSGFNGGTGVLTAHSGTLVDVDETLTVYTDGTVNLIGGRINAGELAFNGSTFNFSFGRLALGGDETISNTKYNKLFPAGIREGQHLSIENRAILETNVSLDGGRLSVGELVNPFLLDFERGTLDFTGDDGLTVGFTGPLGESLELGGFGPFGEPLGQQHVNVVNDDPNTTSTAAIAHEGLVIIHPGSSFGGRQIANRGEIRLLGPGARLNGDTLHDDGGTITNHGLILGLGRVTATLDNQAGGEVRTVAPPQPKSPERIDLATDDSTRSTTPQRMVFTAAGNINAGRITVNPGQSVEFLQDLTNQAGGEITLDQHAALHVNGELTNEGGVTIHGDAELHGPITITADVSLDGEPSNAGRLSVVDNATGTVFGDLTNNGRVQVNDGARLLMLGDVDGGGDFAGSGTVEFAGAYSPGNSPGDINFGGDVNLDGGQLLMELAGLNPGAEYDHLDIAGRFEVNGDLAIGLLDGFTPNPGDSFNLFDFAELNGAFNDLVLPHLEYGTWDTTDLQSEGTITVIPEPATAALLALGGLTLLRRRRST